MTSAFVSISFLKIPKRTHHPIKTDKLDLIKIRNFCLQRSSSKGKISNPKKWKKHLQYIYSDYLKNATNNKEKQRQLVEKWVRDITKQDIWMANKHKKKCSNSLVSEKCKIKPQALSTPIKIAKMNKEWKFQVLAHCVAMRALIHGCCVCGSVHLGEPFGKYLL